MGPRHGGAPGTFHAVWRARAPRRAALGMASGLLMSAAVTASTFRRHASLCALLLELVPGCFDPSAMGESDTDTDTAGEAESSTGMEDPGEGMELLANGSFEMWSSGS